MVDLSTDLGFIKLKNPVITASGTFGYGEEFQDFFNLDILGAFVLKGIYKNPRSGNSPPRIHETASGLLNSIGLPGPGAKESQKSTAIQGITTDILALTQGEQSEKQLNDLMGSCLHMMVNRLFKTKQRLHEMVLYDFLCRYYKSETAKKKYIKNP